MRLAWLANYAPLLGYEWTGKAPTCYVAGPMTGLPDFNVASFERAEEILKDSGWNVLNPATHDEENGVTLRGHPEGDVSKLKGFDLKAALKWDLGAVCRSDAVFVLPGWEYSEGANIEIDVAHKVGVPVYTLLSQRMVEPPQSGSALSDSSPELPRAGTGEGESGGTPSPHQETVCEEADRLVATDRQDDYGHPLDDFSKVTEAAKALDIDPVANGPHHHALYMVLVKLSREAHRPKRDNLVDGCGYFKTADMVLTERERRSREADEMVEDMHADVDPIDVFARMARLNPRRYVAEVRPHLSPEERAAVAGRLSGF